jgi:hypothetical protein
MQDINIYQSDCVSFSYIAENNLTFFFEIRQLYDLTTGRDNSPPIGAIINYSVNGDLLAAGQRVIPNQFILPYHKQIFLDCGNFAFVRDDGSYPYFNDQKGGFFINYFTKNEMLNLKDTAIYCYG